MDNEKHRKTTENERKTKEKPGMSIMDNRKINESQ